MRWLLIVLLVSLGALLVAAAGAARHIWRQRTKPGVNTPRPCSRLRSRHGSEAPRIVAMKDPVLMPEADGYRVVKQCLLAQD